MKRGVLGVALTAVVVVAAVGVGAWFLENEIGPRGAGYHAKVLCSGVFVAGRDPLSVQASDLGRFWYVQGSVDPDARTATSSVYGFGEQTAAHREGLGCTLAVGTTVDALRATAPTLPAPRDTAGLPWPTGDVGATTEDLPGGDRAALDAAVDAAFQDPDPETPRRTRAVVVIWGDRIVAERYATGFDAETPLLGWSMTKSVTATLVGLAAHRGALDISEPSGLSVWPEGDPRAALTTDQLLRMSSGLAFDESYSATGGATRMLFLSPAGWRYAAEQELAHEPDTHWSYSSGTTNILQAVLRERLGPQDYLRFPRQALFDPLGMTSAVLEPDPSGVFVGSSFMYATARDWSRFGLLHLHDGVWEGERLLPEDWVDYATTPTPPSDGLYGAQFWLNRGDPPRWADVPPDAFDASGFEGQNVLVVPSRGAVIVRLGLSPDRVGWDFAAFASDVLAALPPEPAPAPEPLTGEPVDDEVYIHLGAEAWGADAPRIVPEDWAGLVADTPDLTADADGAVLEGGTRLVLQDGVVVARRPDAAAIRVLLALAEVLDGRLTGAGGARFVADPEDEAGFREVRDDR